MITRQKSCTTLDLAVVLLYIEAKEQSAFDFYRLMDTLESSHSEYEDPEFVAES
jgi:hypothetical protein